MSKEKYRDKYLFGGLRKTVLIRDAFTCQVCGMSNDEHIKRFGYSITVDHKDTRENSLKNLWTLCSPCHGRKDVVRRKSRKIMKGVSNIFKCRFCKVVILPTQTQIRNGDYTCRLCHNKDNVIHWSKVVANLKKKV